MRQNRRHRALRQREFEHALAALKARHPWIARHLIEPAPGHLAVVTHLFEQFERVMPPSALKRLPMLCVSTNQDWLVVHYTPARRHVERERAILDLVAHARHLALQHCPVCAAPVIDDGSHPKRCPQHIGVQGLFAEEVRRSRQGLIEQSVQQVIRDSDQLRSDDVPAASDADTGRPTEKADATPTEPSTAAIAQPDIAFLDPAELARFIDRHRFKGDEKFRRAQAIAQRLRATGHGRRRLGVLPDDWGALVDAFEAGFPNFHSLAELLRDHFALSARGDGRVSWPPVLLAGPAGIGKTEAARWLAERLALPFRVFDMASAQSGSPLAGSEAFWSNSEPGLLFELLAYQPLANPIAVLDEVDKAELGHKPYDPLAALYALLEPRSARTFIDLSIRDFSIDASHVNWLATANEVDTLPAPLLSRLTVLQIPAPTPAQVKQIARTIYGRLRAEANWGASFVEALDEAVADRLSRLPPRVLGLTLRRAFGAAARAGRACMRVEDVALPAMPRPRAIGFLARD
jgi:ATP-dependent Lon protease